MNITEKHQKGFGVKNFVEFCIEFFPPPLPLVLPQSCQANKKLRRI